MNALLVLAAMAAKLVATMTANTTCVFLLHQPNLPDGVKKLRKF